MNTQSTLQKLNPWNWFKHEEPDSTANTQIPVTRNEAARSYTGVDSPLLGLHRQIDKLFEDTFKGAGFGGDSLPSFFEGSGDINFRPSLNLASEDERYTLTLEAPGMTDKDITVEINDDVLTIRGNKLEEKEDKEKHFYRMERRYGSFQRVLALPADVQVSDIRASMKNGLLTLLLPRNMNAETTTKKIPIGH